MDFKGAQNSSYLSQTSVGGPLLFPTYQHNSSSGVVTNFSGKSANIDVTSLCEGIGPTRMVREFEHNVGTDSLKLRSAPEHTNQQIAVNDIIPALGVLTVGTTVLISQTSMFFTNPSDCRSMLIGVEFFSQHDVEIAAGSGMSARLMTGPVGGPPIFTLQQAFCFGLGGGIRKPLLMVTDPLQNTFSILPGATTQGDLFIFYDIFFGTITHFGGTDSHINYGWTL